MTPETRKLVADARAVADKIDAATLGPWVQEVSDPFEVTTTARGLGYFDIADCNCVSDAHAIVTARNEAPATIRALAARIEADQTEIESLQETLHHQNLRLLEYKLKEQTMTRLTDRQVEEIRSIKRPQQSRGVLVEDVDELIELHKQTVIQLRTTIDKLMQAREIVRSVTTNDDNYGCIRTVLREKAKVVLAAIDARTASGPGDTPTTDQP